MLSSCGHGEASAVARDGEREARIGSSLCLGLLGTGSVPRTTGTAWEIPFNQLSMSPPERWRPQAPSTARTNQDPVAITFLRTSGRASSHGAGRFVGNARLPWTAIRDRGLPRRDGSGSHRLARDRRRILRIGGTAASTQHEHTRRLGSRWRQSVFLIGVFICGRE